MKGVAAVLTADLELSGPDRPKLGAPTDIYGWAIEQADHVRVGRFDLIDRVLLADEIEDLARREYEALVSELRVTLQHMLKWDHQPQQRSRSWEASIREHRRRAQRPLAASPSLKARLMEAIGTAFEDGRDRASAETCLPIGEFPASCPYEWIDITERLFVLDQDK